MIQMKLGNLLAYHFRQTFGFVDFSVDSKTFSICCLFFTFLFRFEQIIGVRL